MDTLLQRALIPRRVSLVLLNILLVTGLLIGIPLWFKVQDISAHMRQGQHARDLSHVITVWSTEHDHWLPDHGLGQDATANQAFRQLVQEGLLEDESVFGGIRSPFVPDNRIGTAPEFAEAVGKGENHWMLFGGLNFKNMSGDTPMLIENAATATWPPVWRKGWTMPEVRGRTWRGKIIMVRMDMSQTSVTLEETEKGLVLPASAYPEPWQAKPPKILDVEDAK